MKLLMVSGDRQTPVGEVGPFHTMQERFSTHFERIDVLCPQPPRAVTTKTIHGNVHFHPATCGRLGMRSYIAKRGTELIEQHGHDLIVSHDYGWFYNGLGSAAISKRTGVPYVSEIHHVPGFPRAADRREVFDKLIARRYINWAKSRAAAFRVVNHKEMPPLLQSWGVPKSKILVLGSLYIDLDLFSPFSDLEEAVDGVSPKKWDLVFVGRLVNNKGLITIIDALYQLKYRMRPLKLLIVGRGPMRAAVEERVKKHELEKHVEFVEWLETPKDLAECLSLRVGDKAVFTLDRGEIFIRAVHLDRHSWRKRIEKAAGRASLGSLTADEILDKPPGSFDGGEGNPARVTSKKLPISAGRSSMEWLPPKSKLKNTESFPLTVRGSFLEEALEASKANYAAHGSTIANIQIKISKSEILSAKHDFLCVSAE